MNTTIKIIQGSFPGGNPHASVLLQAKIGSQHTGNSTTYQIDSRRLNLTSPGKPLPNGVLQKMESVFKTDFSNVRVHTGREAESIGALAFTSGNNIYFATGQYNPDTPHGQRLLGHELTHVVQQKSGKVTAPLGNEVVVINNPGLEAEAERMSIYVSNSSKNLSDTSENPVFQSKIIQQSRRKIKKRQKESNNWSQVSIDNRFTSPQETSTNKKTWGHMERVCWTLHKKKIFNNMNINADNVIEFTQTDPPCQGGLKTYLSSCHNWFKTTVYNEISQKALQKSITTWSLQVTVGTNTDLVGDETGVDANW